MNVMKMYLENTDETDKSMMSIAGKMNLLLKTMENKGSFFISCINTNIPVKEAEEWYEQGLMGDHEYRKFYETVNLIEESFGFEIYKKSEYPTLYTHSINQIASTYPMNTTQNEKTPLFLRRESKLYEITNIFKSHSKNEIYISLDNKSKPKNKVEYNLTLKELNEVFNNYLEDNSPIYVLKDNEAFVMTLGHFEFDFDVFGSAKESYVFDVEIGDGKYEKIFIRSSYYFDIPVDEYKNVAELLKKYRIIEDGFFEGQFLYYTPGSAVKSGNPITFVYCDSYKDFPNKGLESVEEIMYFFIEAYAFKFIPF